MEFKQLFILVKFKAKLYIKFIPIVVLSAFFEILDLTFSKIFGLPLSIFKELLELPIIENSIFTLWAEEYELVQRWVEELKNAFIVFLYL